MITISEVLAIHEVLIDRFGGTVGVRDNAALEAAIARPYQTFDSQDLYPSIEEKAAAIFESIVQSHPFLDGNKRVGYALLLAFLATEHMDITASLEDRYKFILSTAKGQIGFDEIKNWVKEHTSYIL